MTNDPTETTAALKVGDLVLPTDFRDFEHAMSGYNLRVTRIFKNGNIQAKTDSGNAEWTGSAEGFYRPSFSDQQH